MKMRRFVELVVEVSAPGVGAQHSGVRGAHLLSRAAFGHQCVGNFGGKWSATYTQTPNARSRRNAGTKGWSVEPPVPFRSSGRESPLTECLVLIESTSPQEAQVLRDRGCRDDSVIVMCRAEVRAPWAQKRSGKAS
jgi:hypothetical protein